MAGVALLCAAPPVVAADRSTLDGQIADQVPNEILALYRERGFQPLWLYPDGAPRAAVETLILQIEGARGDGLNPEKLNVQPLRKALDRSFRDPESVERAARLELAASKAYISWVRALRGAPRAAMEYESPGLAPVVPSPAAALKALSAAPDIERFIADMGWMSPVYAPLRRALGNEPFDSQRAAILRANLARARALPAIPIGRFILVDTAAMRLTMYHDGKPVGAMKVVVGKPEMPTPMIAGFVRYAVLNPYWNVPEDLVATKVAAEVVRQGNGFLKAGGYQVMSGWDDDARVVDPRKVDWPSIAAGGQSLRVRQVPGGANSMGRVKFMFANNDGIYLHDTPDKHLMREERRMFSSGCVRLEDAQRLGRWLFGKPLPTGIKAPETRVDLPEPVPVFLTYFTAAPDNGKIVYRTDSYGRDHIATPVLGARSR